MALNLVGRQWPTMPHVKFFPALLQHAHQLFGNHDWIIFKGWAFGASRERNTPKQQTG